MEDITVSEAYCSLILNASEASNTSCYQIRLFKLERQAFVVNECLLLKTLFYLFLYLQHLEQCLAHSRHSVNIAERLHE